MDNDKDDGDDDTVDDNDDDDDKDDGEDDTDDDDDDGWSYRTTDELQDIISIVRTVYYYICCRKLTNTLPPIHNTLSDTNANIYILLIDEWIVDVGATIE